MIGRSYDIDTRCVERWKIEKRMRQRQCIETEATEMNEDALDRAFIASPSRSRRFEKSVKSREFLMRARFRIRATRFARYK